METDPVSEVLSVFFDSFSTHIPFDVISYAAVRGDDVMSAWRRASTDHDLNLKIHDGFRLPLAKTSLGAVAESGEPRIIDDTSIYLARHPQSVATRLIVSEGIRSSLTVPIINHKTLLGFLFFSSREAHAYRDIDLAPVKALASILGVVISQEAEQRQLAAEHEANLTAAHRDPLTGLLNRRGLGVTLDARPTSRQSLAIMFVDIDEMKSINDTFGHAVGDEALIAVADEIRKNVRSSDLIARFGPDMSVARVGGDEFIAVLPSISSPARLQQLGDDIRNGIENQYGWTVSVGIVIADHLGIPIDQLIRGADNAMYESKRRGGNQTIVATAQPDRGSIAS